MQGGTALKKTLLSCILLAALSAGLIGGSAAVLDGRKNEVTVTETVLSGDRLAAEGLQIHSDFFLTGGDHGDIRNIWWTLGQRFAGETAYDVDFHYATEPYSRSYEWEYGGLQLQALGDYTSNSDVDWPQNAAYEDLARRTVADTGRDDPDSPYYTVWMELADYFDVVPIDFALDVPSGLTDRTSGGSGEALYRKLNEVFRIPVTRDMRLLLELRISNEETGALRSGSTADYNEQAHGHENAAGWYDQLFDMAGACTADGVYFTFSPRPDGTPPLDVSQITLGYGIYYLPMVDSTKHTGFREPDPDGLCRAIPLDPAAYDVIDEIVYQEEADRLFILTRKGGTYNLLVYRESTRELLSMLTLDADGEALTQLRCEADGLLALYDGGSFQFIVEGADGYAPVVAGTLSMLWPDAALDDESTQLAFDGERLAIVGGSGWNAAEDFYYIAVFNRDGLQFLASYSTSLSDTRSRSWYYLDGPKPTVAWVAPS